MSHLKVKIVSYYILEFLLAIVLFLLSISVIFTLTIFNKHYIKHNINKNNIVDMVYKSAREEFSYYIIQSGLGDGVLDNIITRDEVSLEVDNYINAYYGGGSTSIDSSSLEKKLKENINNYLDSKNIHVSDNSSLDAFVSEISKTYKSNIEDSFPVPVNIFRKVSKMIIIMDIVLFLLLVVLIYIVSKYRRNVLSIPLVTSGLLSIFSFVYINSNLNMKSFYIYNDACTKLIKGIYNNISGVVITISIIYIIIGILLVIRKYICKNK